MGEHPIQSLMETAMNSIKDMIDVNTIIGDPIEASNGMVIIPISKVSFGFAAGGSEFKGETVDEYKKRDKEEEVQYRLPFGGGSGAGISINPVAFVIVLKDTIKVLPIEHTSVIDKLIDYVPDLMEKANVIVDKTIEDKTNEENISNEENEPKVEVKKKVDIKESDNKEKPKMKKVSKPRNQIVKEPTIKTPKNENYETVEDFLNNDE